jgi:sulfur-oxidizing protein SoxX
MTWLASRSRACAPSGRTPGGRRTGRPALLACVVAAWLLVDLPVAAGPPVFEGDAVPEPLTPVPGDPLRGKEVLVQREKGHCILCHVLPEREVRFAGNVGPPLAGVARRLTPAQIRGRIVDPARHDPETVMPAYFRTDDLRRVASAFRGRTVLSAQDVEDAVAYLTTLR